MVLSFRTASTKVARVAPSVLVLLLAHASGRLPAEPAIDSLDYPGCLLVCDSSADLVVLLCDADSSGSVELHASGEVRIFYDDSSPGPDLSTPTHMATGPEGTAYLLDGGTLDQVLALRDLNGDGDANDAGEVSVFYDGSTGGPALSTPNTLIAGPDGALYLSDDGSKARRILWLKDLDENGDALGQGEARVVYDSLAASVPFLDDLKSMATGSDGVLYVGDATLQAVYALEDLDGDGAFLSDGEARPYFSGTAELTVGATEALAVVGEAVFACDKVSGRMLRLVDGNRDGDAEDEGEVTVFLDATAVAAQVDSVTDFVPLPEGGFVVLDNSIDAVFTVKDLTGDGDALDEGEIHRWLEDEGKTLSTPSGLLLIRVEPVPPPTEREFLRGDTTRDARVDISDPISTLNFLFLGGEVLECQDALDADDSGQVNISDPIFTLNYLFIGGQQPPLPFPEVGHDPTRDSLTC